MITDVLPSRKLGAYASGAHGAGTIAGGRSQAQAPAPGGIHGRPGQMIEPNLYPIRKPWITRLPSPLPPGYALPIHLVSTTCVSAGMIARGAVVGDWPSDSAPRQPCYHVPDGLPYARIMGVSQGLACGSRARDHVEVAAVTPQLCAQWDHVLGSIPLPTTITRGATFGVRQHSCRASRARDPARGIPFPILGTRLLNVLVPISESVRHACDPCP